MNTQSNNHKRKLHTTFKRGSAPGQQLREMIISSQKGGGGGGGEPWVATWAAVLERPGRAHHPPLPPCPSPTPLEPQHRFGVGPAKQDWVPLVTDGKDECPTPRIHGCFSPTSIIDKTRSPLKTDSVSRSVVSDSSKPHGL